MGRYFMKGLTSPRTKTLITKLIELEEACWVHNMH